jgi:hypothetical protein
MKAEDIRWGMRVQNTTYLGVRYGVISHDAPSDETNEKVRVMMYRDSTFKTNAKLRDVFFILKDTEPLQVLSKAYLAAKEKGWLLEGNPDFRGNRFDVEDPEAVSALEEFSTTPGTLLDVYTNRGSLPHVLSELSYCSGLTEDEILPFVKILKEDTNSGIAWDVYVPNSPVLGDFEKRLKVFFGSTRTDYYHIKIGSKEVFKAFFKKGVRPIGGSINK